MHQWEQPLWPERGSCGVKLLEMHKSPISCWWLNRNTDVFLFRIFSHIVPVKALEVFQKLWLFYAWIIFTSFNNICVLVQNYFARWPSWKTIQNPSLSLKYSPCIDLNLQNWFWCRPLEHWSCAYWRKNEHYWRGKNLQDIQQAWIPNIAMMMLTFKNKHWRKIKLGKHGTLLEGQKPSRYSTGMDTKHFNDDVDI